MVALTGQGWESTEVVDGVREVTCSSWNGFSSFIDQVLVDFDSYVFRGQAKSDWKLLSTLDRVLDKDDKNFSREKHLQKFQHASRGRRGGNPKIFSDENEWWALGQHHGLYTPLLDWSESPFVSAYFAFEKERPVKENDHVVVYALSRNPSERINNKIRSTIKEGGKPKTGILEFIYPLTDENPRLISQRGLFTKSPEYTCIIEWININFPGPGKAGAQLLKILIPASERLTALKALNRMNVNHLSLFPDLYGASKHCNLYLNIPKYG